MYAGKTPRYPLLRSPTKEHPRVCGENSPGEVSASLPNGTSPRMRGKLAFLGTALAEARNIPAYAGKTLGKSDSPLAN